MRELFDDKLMLLSKDVLAKKELSSLNLEFAYEKANEILGKQKYLKVRKKLEESEYILFQRSKEYDEILKAVRLELRNLYGVFINKGYKKRHRLLSELNNDSSFENHNSLLKLHKSSNERLLIYREAYEKIFAITGKPRKLLDLACGLNPLSYPYLGCRPEIIACDISVEDMNFISRYFNIMGIQGVAKTIDLVKANPADLEKLSKGCDITFLFKALDSVESVEWNASKRLIQALVSEWIVVSFARRSISGRKDISTGRRKWFFRFLNDNKLQYSTIELPAEVFYVIKNK